VSALQHFKDAGLVESNNVLCSFQVTVLECNQIGEAFESLSEFEVEIRFVSHIVDDVNTTIAEKVLDALKKVNERAPVQLHANNYYIKYEIRK
jgi:signal-transduction protein with cAMP-binding, CBS, and nucleotidyltransferase domain